MKNNINFKGAESILFKTLPAVTKPVQFIISSEEGSSGLSHIRFIQDTATNLAPKATFSRSKEDLFEASFLEISESLLVYYGPLVLGKLFKNVFSKNLNFENKKLFSEKTKDLISNKVLKEQGLLNKVVPRKAALALSFLAIPLTEYTLNYFKNLLTLKTFKKADFANVINLKNKESQNKKEKVEKNAKKSIKKAGILYAASLALASTFAIAGHKSKMLYSLSEFVLNPVGKVFKNAKNLKVKEFFEKHLNIDYEINDGKLGLSKGQLASCVLVGGAGYFGAAKDRGKLEFLEVLTRFPLVGFYVVFGSSMFKKSVNLIFSKLKKYPDILNEKAEAVSMEELPKIAEKLASLKNTSVEKEFKRLFKQKAVLSIIPFLFGIGFMGFFVAGMNRFWTNYRFKHGLAQEKLTMEAFLEKTKI